MATITVKNIPDELYAHLKQAARLSRRSINSEIIVCIERKLRSQKISAETMLKSARRLRAQTHESPITDVGFTKTKAAGRP